MKKQLLFFVLMLMPLMANASTKINGIYYYLKSTNKVAEVTYVPSGTTKYSGSITIPKTVSYGGVTYSVTSIGAYAFQGCSGLTSVTIPNSVTSIVGSAFSGCSGLNSLTIPNSVTSIGERAFSGCSGLNSLTIPNSVTFIGNYAFSGCSGLNSLTIPNSVTSIVGSAFSGCSSLTSIVVENGNTVYDSRNNCNAIIKTSTNELIAGCKSTIIPNGVTSIGYQAFSGCSGLTSVTIPNSVTSIGYQAFSGCSNLPVVNSCRYADTYLVEVVDKTIATCEIKEGTRFIGNGAFSGCSSLTCINIPNSVTSISNSAFFKSGCSGLTSITVENGNPVYDSRNNCNAIIETSTNELIVGCKSTIIPNSVTSIGDYAFSGCSGLTSVTIPNSVTSISGFAFEGCSGLTSVTIGNSVTYIGENAIYGYSALTEVRCFAEEVPSTDIAGVFGGCSNCTLYVPENSLNKYKSTSPWSEFGNIVSLSDTPVYTLTYTVDGQIYKSYEYEEGENIVPEPAPTKEGYFFSGWSEIPETMPAHNVTVTGSFMLPSKCETPVITFLANGKIKVESATEGATCVTNITASNAEPLADGEISLNTPLTVYTVTSYATKEGYNDSEVATATFRYEKTEGDMNGDGMLNITDVIHLVNMILGQ